MRRIGLWAVLSLIFLSVTVVPRARTAKPEVWIEVQSPHFTVISDAGEKQGRRVAYRFEQIRLAFHETFPRMTNDPIAPIIVLAVNRKGFKRLDPASWDRKGEIQHSGLLVKTPEKNYVLINLSAPEDMPYHTLFHEYTHLLIHQSVGHIPLWLDEGLAEYYGYTEIHKMEIWLGYSSAGHVDLLRRAPLIPLPTLFRVDHESPYYSEQHKGNMFYAESWALTHMLMVQDFRQRTNVVSAYINAVLQGADSVTAAQRTFGDLSRLQKRFEAYVRRQRFHFLRLKASGKVDKQGFSSRQLTPAQADAQRGDLLVSEQRYDEGRALLSEALQTDPSNAAAAVSMGFLEFRQRHNAEAEKWFTRAVALNSKSYLANYYYAAMAMRNSPSAAAEPRVEQSLKTAIQINPRFAPAYATLANLYEIRGENFSQAHALALQAVALDPTNVKFYMITASVLLRMEDASGAIRLCQKAASLAKTPAELSAVTTELHEAERYQFFLEQHKQVQQARPAASKAAVQSAVRSAANFQAAEVQPPVLVHQPQKHGPRDESNGVIKSVTCSAPASLDMVFQTVHRTLHLHTDNYFQLVYNPINFVPRGVLNPCTQIAGMKAHAVFYDVEGHPGEGDLISLGLKQ